MKRIARLAQIQRLLYRNPEGLTSKELATLCGVHVRTILRDLLDLQAELGVPVTQEHDRYAILSGYALPPVSFSFYEAVALFLACRLATRQSGSSNPHMAQALAKTAAVLPAALGEYLRHGLEPEVVTSAIQKSPDVFESVATAWMKQLQMKIRYINLRDGQEREWLFDPYFMEMAGVGYAIYVFGRGCRDGRERFVSFKLDRIASAEVLETAFEPPSKSEVKALLSRAWESMWEEESEVALWFSRCGSLIDEAGCNSSSLRSGPLDDGYMMTLHVSGWLQPHPAAMDRGSQTELLSQASVVKHFSDYARKLWRTSCVLLQERARGTGAASNLDK